MVFLFGRGNFFPKYSFYHTAKNAFFLFLFLKFIDFRERKGARERGKEGGGERERDRNTDLLFHSLMHSSVDSCMRSD